MIKPILTSLTLLFAAGVSAQVVLTSAHMPPTDSSYIFSDADAPSPTFVFQKSGTTAVWDFTTLTTDSMNDDTIAFVDPSTLAPSGTFTGATHARIRRPGDDFYGVLKVDPTGAYLVGGVGDLTGFGGNVAVPYETPVTVHTFPFTSTTDITSEGIVNFKSTGAYFGEPSIDSVWLRARTTSASRIIANGTLILPSGTWPAMLEVLITTTVDSSMIKGSQTGGQWLFIPPNRPSTTIDSTYNWYTQASLMPYATVDYEGGAQDVSFFKGGVVNHTGVKTVSSMPASRIYPNPFTASISIESADGPVSYELFSIDGRRMLDGTVAEGTDKIATTVIPPGLYLLKLQSKSGSRTMKLVKE